MEFAFLILGFIGLCILSNIRHAIDRHTKAIGQLSFDLRIGLSRSSTNPTLAAYRSEYEKALAKTQEQYHRSLTGT